MVVRLNKNGELKNSRPCTNCIKTMLFYNIKKVIYSDDSGNLITEKVMNMEMNHVSSGWNYFNNFHNQ